MSEGPFRTKKSTCEGPEFEGNVGKLREVGVAGGWRASGDVRKGGWRREVLGHTDPQLRCWNFTQLCHHGHPT